MGYPQFRRVAAAAFGALIVVLLAVLAGIPRPGSTASAMMPVGDVTPTLSLYLPNVLKQDGGATATATRTPTATPTPTATTAAQALFDTALSLDGVDAYASAPDSASLDLGVGAVDDFTLETFFYLPDLNNDTTDTLVWKQGAYGLYILYHTATPDRFIYRIWTGAATYNFVSYDVNLTVGWHHVAAVFDNENTDSDDLMALYVDGGLAASGTGEWTPGIPNSASALNIGAYIGVNPAASWIEETRFSDSVRYTAATYSVPVAPFADDASTLALWHFDETPGTTSFADGSGNGHTLTGFNGAQTGNP